MNKNKTSTEAPTAGCAMNNEKEKYCKHGKENLGIWKKIESTAIDAVKIKARETLMSLSRKMTYREFTKERYGAFGSHVGVLILECALVAIC